MKQKRTIEELQRIVDRQLARIRRGEPMVTIKMLPSRAAKWQEERKWKEGGNAPHRSPDVSY
jgi:hypothetical protein